MELYSLALAFLFLSCRSSGLNWSMQCSSEPEGLTLTPVLELPGRYNVRWCSQEAGQRVVRQWRLVVFEELGEGSGRCHGDLSRRRRHSLLLQDIAEHIECAEEQRLCFTAPLDMLYTACYALQSSALPGGSLTERVLYLNSTQPDGAIYNRSEALLKISSPKQNNNDTILHWYFGHIPITDYKIEIEKVTEHSSEEQTFVPINCEPRGSFELRCVTRLAGGSGTTARYHALLHHDAPWTRGDAIAASLKTLYRVLEINGPVAETDVTSRAGYGVTAAWGVGGVVALAGLVALMVWSRRGARGLSDAVKRTWAARYNNVPDIASDALSDHSKQPQLQPQPKMQPQPRPILLFLYGRDCLPLMRVAAELRSLLELGDVEVVDLHSPSTMSRLAQSPAASLRAMLALPSTRAVLLETPAAAMLYAPAPNEDGTVSPPLLGSRVLYRAPAASDQLLLLTLPMLTDLSYHRLYIATTDLRSKVLPHTQRYRRYPLPAAALKLLSHCTRALHHTGTDADDTHDAAAATDAAQARLAALRAACDTAQQYARDRPDYLKDELVFL